MSRHFEPLQLAVIWLRIVGAGFALVGGGLVILALAALSAGRIVGDLEIFQIPDDGAVK